MENLLPKSLEAQPIDTISDGWDSTERQHPVPTAPHQRTQNNPTEVPAGHYANTASSIDQQIPPVTPDQK